MCSSRSLRRYFTAWSKSNGDRLSLLPATALRGARGRPKRHGMLQRNPILRRLVDEAIQSIYLTTARRPISAVVRRVFEDVQRHNSRLPASQAIPLPRSKSLWQSISRRIAQLDVWEVDRARWGRRIADRRHSQTSRQRLASRILERVEIDHSPLKLVVGTDAGPIGQPWLTVLIDYYSRLIIGFCVGFEPPSYAVLMEALRHAILPKTYVAELYPRVQGRWPCFGIPEKLVCDRGADLTSKDLEQAAFQLNMELNFNPPRTPHFKGTVESFFDSFNDHLISSLPGRTFRSWERRADYNADRGPMIPFETLVEVIHLYLIDIYSMSKHPTSAVTRLEMWQRSAAEYPPCLPSSPDDLVLLLAKSVERTLSARGIELNGMFYNADELMALRADLTANNLSAERFKVRYNPWNLGHAWLLNPLDQRYIKLSASDAAMVGMTEFQWKVVRRAVRECFDHPEQILSLAAKRNVIREVVEAAVKTPSKRRRTRAARFLGSDREAQPATTEVASDALRSPIEALDRHATHDDEVEGNTTESSASSAELDETISPYDLNVDDWEVA
jgi:putative transposase